MFIVLQVCHTPFFFAIMIEQFKQHLQQLGFTIGTQNLLPNCLKEFLQQANKELQTIDKTDILNYYEYIKNRPKKRGIGTLSESMVNHHIYSLKVFFIYQMEIGRITVNPMSTLIFPKPTSKPREILTQKEIKQLFEACTNHRERAVLSLCYGLGLRRSEAVKITIEDINFSTGLAYIREGKGKKRRVIPMNKSIILNLENYLNKERKAKETNVLITTKSGNKSSGENINNTLKQTLERTEIEKKITLHCLRHSIATHLLENGLSVENVRTFLGHKHLESTQIYTRIKNKQLWKLNST